MEADRNGTEKGDRRTHILYPDTAAFVKQMDALEHEEDFEKLESGRRAAKEYEEMLRKALAIVSDFSGDGGGGGGGGGSEEERVQVVDSPVQSVGLEKGGHRSVQETGGGRREEESEEEDTGGDRRDDHEGSEGNGGGRGGGGGSDVDLDKSDDDGDGDGEDDR